MITYADSSVLVAWFHPDDRFAKPVTQWCRANVTDFLWNPILRLEVRHNLRRLRSNYSRTAWNALRAAERIRLRFGREKLHDLIEDADDLSAKHGASVPAGTWDFSTLRRPFGSAPRHLRRATSFKLISRGR